MKTLMAAALAAAISWAGNKALLRYWMAEAVMYFTPLLEEASKTLTAVYLNQPIIWVHGVFGAIEAIYDLAVNRKNGPIAALVSLAGHLLYGVLTSLMAAKGGMWAGIALAYIAHTVWNVFVVKHLA